MIGFEDGNIRPTAYITRAQLITMLFRLMSQEERENYWSQDNSFHDVRLAHWFNNPISTAYNAGVAQGLPCGNFQPDRPITNAEMAAALVRRFYGTPQPGPTRFTDISGHWAELYIITADRMGWITRPADPQGRFFPNAAIQRAEVAGMVNRSLGRIPESTDDLHINMRIWADNKDPYAWYFIYIQEATITHKTKRSPNNTETWIEIIYPDPPWHVLERPDSLPDDLYQYWTW